MCHVKARANTLLFHGRHVGFGHGTFGAFVTEGTDLLVVTSNALGNRMLGCDGNERDAHERIGTRRVHIQKLLFPVEFIGEGNVHARALSDPVVLHATHLIGPTRQFI